jgi:GSH-dependent disulfide-bond oxidoreductase
MREERYLSEGRLYGVLDRRLADHQYVADSVTDIAIWPWVSRYEWQTIDLDRYIPMSSAGISPSPPVRP